MNPGVVFSSFPTFSVKPCLLFRHDYVDTFSVLIMYRGFGDLALILKFQTREASEKEQGLVQVLQLSSLSFVHVQQINPGFGNMGKDCGREQNWLRDKHNPFCDFDNQLQVNK